MLVWSRNKAAGRSVIGDLVVCRVGSGLVGCYSNSMSVSLYTAREVKALIVKVSNCSVWASRCAIVIKYADCDVEI